MLVVDMFLHFASEPATESGASDIRTGECYIWNVEFFVCFSKAIVQFDVARLPLPNKNRSKE